MVWWLLLRERDEEEADAEDGFTTFQNYRRFRSLLRSGRKKSGKVPGGNRTEVPEKVGPSPSVRLIAFGILLAAAVVLMVLR